MFADPRPGRQAEPDSRFTGGFEYHTGMNPCPRERPSFDDGTHFVVFLDLPPGVLTVADLYPHVYGVRLNHGAKPWPCYRDADTKAWWSLSTPSTATTDAVAWMIPLDQLGFQPVDEARGYLEDVLAELDERAARAGGTAVPECTAAEAADRISLVREYLKLRDYTVSVVVAAPEGRAFRVGEWWAALEGVGLERGDGNLFWLYSDPPTDGDDAGPEELVCAEPFSVPGYFHVGNRGGNVRFPDVALHFRARDTADPVSLLHRTTRIATELAVALGARVLNADGDPFDVAAVERKLRRILERQRALRRPGS